MAVAFTLAGLKAELLAVPDTMGYSAKIVRNPDQSVNLSQTDYDGLAALLAAPKAGVTVKRTDVMPQELLEVMNDADLATPSAGQLMLAQMVLSLRGGIRMVNEDGTNTRCLNTLRSIFVAAGTGTRAAITAISSRTGSRAEELWGVNTVVSAPVCAQALGS